MTGFCSRCGEMLLTAATDVCVECAQKPAPAYAALNEGALRQFIDDAIRKERERVLGLIEADISWRTGSATQNFREHLLRLISKIREAGR